MAVEGKGFFIWKIESCEGGDVAAIAELARQAGLTHVLIKIADRTYPYNQEKSAALVRALRAANISPWGWHFVYGDQPEAEARVAVEEVSRLRLDGYVIDAEEEYKQPGKKTAAETFMRLLRRDLPHTPMALSSYRYPSYHPQLPWREFLEKCDYNMPQVYWIWSNSPAVQLQRCLREFRAMTPVRPIIPTGAAYAEHGWSPTREEIRAFLEAARTNNLPGVNFWEWSAARRLGFWETIAEFDWESSPPAEKDIAEKYIEALNTRLPDEVVKLYAPNSVHVTAQGTVQGIDNIRVWYARLFVQILPNATFTLTGYSGVGSARHLTWTATSSAGNVLNGNDTLGLIDGKIGYHYTFFTVT